MIKTSNELCYGKCWTAVSKGIGGSSSSGGACRRVLVRSSRSADGISYFPAGIDGGSSEDPGGGLTFNAKGDLFGTTSIE